MSPRSRLLLAAAATAVVAAAAPAAQAAPVLTNNACQGDGSNQWGTLPLQLEATGTANDRTLDVSAIQPKVDIPSWLPTKVASYGLLIAGATNGAGQKNVKVDAWMAVAGEGSADAPKVMQTAGALKFTLNDLGWFQYSVTNMSLELGASATSSWRAADAGGALNVMQAPAGSLPAIPGGQNGATVNPKGSLWIRGTVSGVPLTIDCQPGSTSDPQNLTNSFTPGKAAAIVSASFAALPGSGGTGTPATPTPAPTTTPAPGGSAPVGAFAIASTTVKFGSAAVLVNVACPAGGPDCTGSATMTSAKKLKVGKGKAKVRKLAAGTYTVKAGTSGPIKLKLSSDGKKLKKKKLVATLTLKPTKGTAIKKNIRAN